MKNKKKTILYPIYLDDNPISQETGLSKAITDEISSNPEQNRIIGLLGSWGSGKSSAIEAIKNGLKEKCTIFEYDAWKNEQFPFKLGFLKFLLNEVNSEENEELYNKLQNKVNSLEQVCQEQKSRQQGIISFDNLIIALPVAFFPLAFSLLNGTGKINVNIITDILLNSNYKVLLYVILFSILKLINWRLKSEKSSMINFGSISINMLVIIGLSILSIFINTLQALILFLPLLLWLLFNLKNFVLKIINLKTEYSIISITTPDVKNTITINKSIEPSFIDFQETYNDILSYSYLTKKNRSFLIVIDNIDRIEIEETKKIWSALKGMILKDNKNNNIYTNIIIPVDEEQILKLYDDNQNEDTDNKSASFVQKTFDMTYRVNPFILDNVEKFLYQKLDESFGKDRLSTEEKQKILNIFNSRNYKGEENLFVQSSYKGQATPRKIIKLINEVVSLERNLIYKDVTIAAKFAYIIHYNNISAKIQNKNYKNFLPNNSITMINIEKNELSDLISLYYGVNRESAIKLARTEELVNKIYSKEDIDKSILQIPNIWLMVNDIVENTIFDKPFSIIMNCLRNIIALNSNNEYTELNNILKNIISKLIALTCIDDYTSIDSDIICCTLKNIDNRADIIETIKLLYNFDESKNEYSKEEAENWYRCCLSIILNFNISKSEIYDILSSYIPETLYKHVVNLVKPEDMEYIDSYILEYDSEKLVNIKDNEFIYKNINFILNFPPLDEEKNDWMDKVYKLNSSLIDLLNINYKGVINLLYKYIQITQNKDEEIKKYILSDEYFSKVLNINYNNKESLSKAFAIYSYFEPSLSKAINFLSRQPSISHWRVVFNEKDEKYISEYATSYINLQNDILSVYTLPQSLSNKNLIISYAIDNIKEFNMKAENFFKFFDKYSNEQRNILYNKFIECKNSNEIMSHLDYSNENIPVLYYLSCKDDARNNIINKANAFLSTIPEEQWENESRNCSNIFKIALNLNFDNAGFKNVFYKIDKIMMEKGIDNFINSMQNEIEKLQEYDKTYKFINNLLDNNIKNIKDPASIINNFGESTLKWLKKTSHDSETLYTDFIRKINNEEWLIHNKTSIEKHILSVENKTNFADRWKEHDEIKNAYKEIFEKVQQQDAL